MVKIIETPDFIIIIICNIFYGIICNLGWLCFDISLFPGNKDLKFLY